MRSTSASRTRALAPLETDIQKAVVDMLHMDNWRCFRTELTVQREYGRAVGEAGQPDYLAIRYLAPHGCAHSRCIPTDHAAAQLLWIEFKRGKFGKLSQAQKFWHAAERQRGALVWVVVSVNDFIDQYHASGLMRKAFLAKARTA